MQAVTDKITVTQFRPVSRLLDASEQKRTFDQLDRDQDETYRDRITFGVQNSPK